MNETSTTDNKINQKLAFRVLQEFPSEFSAGLDFASGMKVNRNIDKIVVSGMGGSSFPAAICKTYLDNSINVPYEISRDYTIQSHLTTRSLVFIVSYSGNTEETISSFYDALERKAKIIVITAGGKLLNIANKQHIPVVRIKDPMPYGQESLSTGYFVSSILGILDNSGIVSNTRKDLLGLEDYLRKPQIKRKAKTIARKLSGWVPIIYTSSKYEESIARILKIRFNQNSKCPAFYNVFSEMNHNELLGFSHNLAHFHFLFVEDPSDDPRIQRRMKIFRQILCPKMGISSTTISMVGVNTLQKIIGIIYLFEWVTLYLAEDYDVDPLEANLIDDLKSALDRFS